MHSRQFYQGLLFYEYNFQEFFSAQICFRVCEVKGRKVKKLTATNVCRTLLLPQSFKS